MSCRCSFEQCDSVIGDCRKRFLLNDGGFGRILSCMTAPGDDHSDRFAAEAHFIDREKTWRERMKDGRVGKFKRDAPYTKFFRQVGRRQRQVYTRHCSRR